MKFNQRLYRRNAKQYDRFMRACSLEDIMRNIPQEEFVHDKKIIELGSGTGIFTREFARAARKVYAIDCATSQLNMLRRLIAAGKIGNITVIQENAHAVLPFDQDRIDACFFTFSFDEIAGLNWNREDGFDETKVNALLDRIRRSSWTGSPRIAIISAMPEKEIPEEKRGLNLKNRKKLLHLLETTHGAEIKFFPYGVTFENYDKALNVMGEVVGIDYATRLLNGKCSFTFERYAALIRG